MSKKRNGKESLMPKNKSQKIFDVIGVSLWPTSSPGNNPIDYARWDISENKTNATSHPNIGLLKTATVAEWNKISKEFIVKACKSF